MKNEMDSNFAIAILALVAACVGVAFYVLQFNTEIESTTPTNIVVPQPERDANAVEISDLDILGDEDVILGDADLLDVDVDFEGLDL